MEELPLLNTEERELLVGLALAVVAADGALSAEESGLLRNLGQAMGAEVFVESARVARERFPDDESVLAAARTLTSPRARRTIYGTLRALAESGGVTDSEQYLLDELAAAWGIK